MYRKKYLDYIKKVQVFLFYRDNFSTNICTINIRKSKIYFLASTEFERSKIPFLVPASNKLGRSKFLLGSNSIKWDKIPIHI